MNQTHVYLLINHLPVFGTILGAFVLAYAIWFKSDQTKIAAYNLFVISTLGAIISYITGEAAEDTVENIPGISENMIGQHEDSALYALIAICILGILAIFGLFLTYMKSHLSRNVAVGIFLFSLLSFALIARTGYLGGQIRHTELSANNATDENEE